MALAKFSNQAVLTPARLDPDERLGSSMRSTACALHRAGSSKRNCCVFFQRNKSGLISERGMVRASVTGHQCTSAPV